MEKYKVSKQFLLDGHSEACQKWKKRIEEEVPELFEEEFEVGDWVKTPYGHLYCITLNPENVKKDRCRFGAFGFFDGEWYDYSTNSNILGGCGWQKATKEEVESALIAEAERRGYVKGAKFKNISTGYIQTIERYNHWFFLNNCALLCGRTKESEWENTGSQSNAHIFKNGKWAEIIEQPKDVDKETLRNQVAELSKQIEKLKKQIG